MSRQSQRSESYGIVEESLYGGDYVTAQSHVDRIGSKLVNQQVVEELTSLDDCIWLGLCSDQHVLGCFS